VKDASSAGHEASRSRRGSFVYYHEEEEDNDSKYYSLKKPKKQSLDAHEDTTPKKHAD
jgi:hypothetical protein